MENQAKLKQRPHDPSHRYRMLVGSMKLSRHTNKYRFAGGSDWKRVVLLGILLVLISALSLLDTLIPRHLHLPGHIAGSSAIFGGMAIAILVSKISRGAFYGDWLLSAGAYILAGIAFASDEAFLHFSTAASMIAFLLACGLFRIWIGLTSYPSGASPSMTNAGLVTLLCALWTALAWAEGSPQTAATALALDTLFCGVAIVAFGAALKYTPRAM
jgi:uncharacterized membrane protein HdeD (DUF308 family)